MFAIVINEKGGESKRLEFDKAEVTIGRVQGNDIILPKGNVSKRHSRIVLKDGKFIIVDLKSTNGTYVNGRKITSPLVIKGTDKVYIGDFILSVEDQLGEPAAEPPPAAVQRRSTMPPPPPVRRPSNAAAAPAPPPEASGDGDSDGAGDDYRGGADNAGAEADLPPPPAAPPPPAYDEPPPEPVRARPALASRPGPVGAPPRPAVEPARPTMMAEAPSLPARVPAAAPAARAPVGAPPRPSTAPQTPVRRSSSPGVPAAPAKRPAATLRSPAAVAAASGPDERRAQLTEAMRQLAARLIARLSLDSIERKKLSDPDLWARAEQAVQEMIEDVGPPPGDRDALVKDVVAEALGLGPIEELLADESVREIAVPRHDRIFVDRDGQVTLADRWFSSPAAVARVLDRLTGGQAAENGLVEARLNDGTLVTAAVAPLAAAGASLTLRRPRREAAALADLVGRGMLSQGMSDFLALAVAARRNILVVGGAGSGRSTTLGALANAAPDGQRVISVEDAEELQLRHDHWVQLTTRGGGARAAIAAALRLRPDHLVVGDLHGGEAVLILEAAAGVSGVLASLYGTSAVDGLQRFEALAQIGMSGSGGRSVAEAVGRHLHLIVCVARGADGTRRVAQIAEVTGPSQITDLFIASDDGRFAATGHVPAFAEGAPSAMFRS